MCLELLHSVLAWTKGSGWKKEAKCKRLIQQIQSHLSVQRKRRETIIRQSRLDIAQLLLSYQLQKALDRVEQLYKDHCLLSAYDQIEHFCGCIATNIPHISRESTLESLPSEVSEAVSSLVFTASRCGEMPELNSMRKLLKQHFGCRFEVANVELHKGNLVNSNMKENLCLSLVSDDVKLNLIDEIAKEYNLHLEWFQDFEQNFSPQCQQVYRIQTATCEVPNNIGSNCSISNRTNSSSMSDHVKRYAVEMDRLEALSSALKSSPRKCDASGKKKNGKESFENRLSFDCSIDELKEQKIIHSFSGHVHPNLPDYKDVLAKLTDLKSQYKQRRRFSCSKDL